MRTSDSDLIMVPGPGRLDPGHWQVRWGGRLSTARFVTLNDDEIPEPDAWAKRIAEAVQASTRPVMILAHGLGVIAAVRAVPRFGADAVRAAFMVAPVDVERPDVEAHVHAFSPLSRDPLPFPSLLVASQNDPNCSYDRADDFGHAWGSALVDAGEAGSLDGASGHGPWPEGLMRLAGFMRGL